MQDFPGQPRSNAVGFNIGNTGYIGSGLAGDGKTALADFYAYNPASNTWSPIDSIHNETSSFPRYDAVAFSFDTTAYVLTGTDGQNYFGDVWRYSPTINTWIQEIYYPGSRRSGAVSFVYHGQGYLVTGFTPGDLWSKGDLCYDFWRFTPETDSSINNWARLNDIYDTHAGSFDGGYTDIIRTHASSFMILGQPDGDKGYVTLGSGNGGIDVTSTWEYDFATDLWTAKSSFQGAPRANAVSFTLTTVPAIAGVASTRGFVAAGLNQGASAAFADCYEFFPNYSNNQQ
jgi:N-acetylneuraminic acid mutarotase